MEIQNCSICLEQIGNKEKCKIDGCSHEHHYECLKKWIQRENSCPQCRKKFTKIYNWEGGCEKVEARKQRIPHENFETGNHFIGFQFIRSPLLMMRRNGNLDFDTYHNERLTQNVYHQNRIPPFLRRDRRMLERAEDERWRKQRQLKEEQRKEELKRVEERRRKEDERKKNYFKLHKKEVVYSYLLDID